MRIALGIEYDGQPYHGWQAQSGLITVQGCLEEALTTVADKPIQVICAGRTDAGVHATGQVVHFDTEVIRSVRAWLLGTNANLPPTIAVRWAQEVDEQFHARFSALSRRYRYIIYNCAVRSAVLASRVTWYYYPLDIERMQNAANYLLGEQDFSSFRSSQCQAKSPMRKVTSVEVIHQGDMVIIEIEANAFLHHMVRNIAGTLMRIGSGLASPQWMQEVLQAKDRRQASETADAKGLYLTEVRYPEPYSFPQTNTDLFLLHPTL